jgi:GxxExxY protein
MPSEAQLNRLSQEVIAAAIIVHRRIGPGCLESAYSPCFALELTKRKIDFRREVALTLRYDELVIPRAYVQDYVIEDCLIGELKAHSVTTKLDGRQLQTYLEISGLPLGLILNFGALRLTDGIKRVVNNFPYGTTPLTGDSVLIR